jgi:hypothetical protein
MVHDVGSGQSLAKYIVSQRSGKVKAVRINCVRDQALRREPDMVAVIVPETHPLFNLEGDDPFAVPYALEWRWVAKLYGSSKKTKADEVVPSGAFANPLARLLLTPITKFSSDDDYDGDEEQDFDRWEPIWKGWKDPDIGSVLVVDRERQDFEIDKVRAMCKFIEQKVAPLLTEERACDSEGEEEVAEAITMKKLKRFLRA